MSAQFDLLAPVRVPEHGSQCWELLMAFQAGERLTTMEAFRRFGITTISQRVGDLKRKYGWPIKSAAKQVGPKTYVAEYFLERSISQQRTEQEIPRDG
jgi:hypothetical protein